MTDPAPDPDPDSDPDLGPALDLDYVLPLRWDDDGPGGGALDELTAYLRRLARHTSRVVVVDGSPDELFERHAARWRGLVVHVRPAADLRFANGKVNGVTTGLRLARADHVVIADDDVRYDRPALARMRALLDRAHLVRPQNHFEPLPWHARWDTARTLLNRSLGSDYPGTFGVRRGFFLRMGGYDGDVLFENLELIRTVRAHGGTECRPAGLYVRRLPPEAGRFWSQRVRQAYDDLAQPARMAVFLAVLPAAALALLRRRYGLLAAGAGLTVALAEAGRRRAGGRRVFPWTASLFAPVWVLERAVCGWLALAAALRGGVPYAGRRLRRAAHSDRWLRAHAVRTPVPDARPRAERPAGRGPEPQRVTS
ncbi:glycosyltransferase family A protein [Nonomuraea muscovyensis]|uniref:glycosyltransferase n=1 Tax=Nonomuraea muscovyensis TaxID=1124761 RepID=UPI0034068880